MPVPFYRVLGATAVEIDGVAVGLGGPVPRRVLTALLATRGHPLSDDRLFDQVWGATTRDMTAALRVVVWRLRTALPVRETLSRTEFGYTLTVPETATDTELFTSGIRHGLALLAAGDGPGAVRTLESALRLWRGDPWLDLGESAHTHTLRRPLTELREVAVEELQAAHLSCGNTLSAVAALQAAVDESPYRERRWELLALALYRSGRQAHAFAALRRVHHLLATEIGVAPGPALRTLQHRMLTHDPALLLAHPTLSRAG